MNPKPYEWNYKRQLLHIQVVSNQNLSVQEIEEDIFSETFCWPGLAQMHCLETPTVMLIDEIDKVDFEFEAMLLELLSEFQITIPEIGTIAATHHPYVFLTSNTTRSFRGLKRRCLYLYLDFPSKEMEQQILMFKSRSFLNNWQKRWPRWSDA